MVQIRDAKIRFFGRFFAFYVAFLRFFFICHIRAVVEWFLEEAAKGIESLSEVSGKGWRSRWAECDILS